jgi:hypothetical protein
MQLCYLVPNTRIRSQASDWRAVQSEGAAVQSKDRFAAGTPAHRSRLLMMAPDGASSPTPHYVGPVFTEAGPFHLHLRRLARLAGGQATVLLLSRTGREVKLARPELTRI